MINIPEEKLREGYWYVLKNRTGYQEDLDKIHPMMSLYLIDEGVIGEGINSRAELRYHLTELGEDIAELNYITITRRLFHKKVYGEE